MKRKKFLGSIIMILAFAAQTLVSCSSEETFEVEKTTTSVSNPYLIADTLMSVQNNEVRCKLIIKKVTPLTFSPNDTVKVEQFTIAVSSMGSPGNNSLKVFSGEMTNNIHTDSLLFEEKLGQQSKFYWLEKCQLHHFRADWNTNGLVVGHTDDIYVYSHQFGYKSDEKEFKYNFETELKVAQNEVIQEAEYANTPDYLGTRVLTIEGYCNGLKFFTSTGKTTLYKHPE